MKKTGKAKARKAKGAKPKAATPAKPPAGKAKTVIFSGSADGRDKVEAIAAKAGLKVTTPAQIEAEKRAATAPGKKPARKREGMTGLEAAAKVLGDSGKPLGSKEIVDRMLKRKLWSSKGATPEATLHAAMSREIATKGKASRFRKAGRGRFAITAAGKKG